MAGLTLEAGALIAFDRALARRVRLAVPAGVIGQVWRDGRRQVRLVRLLASEVVDVEPLDDARARAAGQLCDVTKTRDVIDASVVLCAHARDHGVLTTHVADLRRLDPSLRLVAV